MSAFGATIFGCSGLELTTEERAFFRDVTPFGFILFARNVESADQLRQLCDDLRGCVDHAAPILIDQEGGRVQRLRAPLATEWPPALDHVAQASDRAERAMYLRYRVIAHELLSMGIDCNCAPMVDVVRPETHAIVRNRCYADTPEAVARIGRAVAQGLLDGGVLPVVKHIPGYGRARVDSHLDLPRVSASVEELETDFAPFRALNDLPMGMTAHIVMEALDEVPATVSPRIMGLIREDIGFGGLIMPDDISMEALSGTVDERARDCLAAGCDVVLHCNGKLSEMQAVARASGAMTAIAQARAEAALAARKTPVPVDIQALAQELETF